MRVARALLALLLPLSACKGADKPSSGDDTAKRSEPDPLPEPKMIPNRGEPAPDDNLRAELPPLGHFAKADVPLTYEDGAYSIRGLRADFDAQIKAGEDGRDVVVRAWVQEIYVPEPGCTPGPYCRQPHFFVTDGEHIAGRRLAMLVGPHGFEYDAKVEPRYANVPDVSVELGRQYSIRGKFVRFSETGFADERGLLQLVAVQNEDGEWIYPKGAPWHPYEVERRETQERDLMLRLQREATASARDRSD